MVTYKHIAELFSESPRNVGRIMSMNDHPEIYPCYKVIRSDGKIGGYTHNGKNDSKTVKLKAKKLTADGIRLKGNVIDESSIIA